MGIDDTVQRHAAQLEKVYFLAVHACHRVVRVWQTGKGDFVLGPVLLKGLHRIGPHRQNFSAATFEFLIAIPQARQLRAAVGSHKPPQKCKHHGLTTQAR